jgi:hypothetical protein
MRGLALENVFGVAYPQYPQWAHTRRIQVELLMEAGLTPISNGTGEVTQRTLLTL